MSRVAAGQFVRKDDVDPRAKPQNVQLTRDFWLSDREVTMKLFHEFVDDKTYMEQHPDEALTDWSGEERFQSSDPLLDHPVQQVNWEDTVKFCNWLSGRENREVLYRRVKRSEGTSDVWEFNKAATGYRLPTEAQWEWCQDLHEKFGSDEVVADPNGPDLGSSRVFRCGGWSYSARFCRSALSSGFDPSFRDFNLGFRVALSSSGQESSLGSAKPPVEWRSL